MSDDLSKWQDSLDGLVHIVGRHVRGGGMIMVFADCGTPIAEVRGRTEGFLRGNTQAFVTCLGCLGASNFGTYASR